MKNSDSTIVIDIFKAYALAFFFTIALGNILVYTSSFFASSMLNELGNLLISLACPVIAFTLGVFLKLSPVGMVSLFLVGAVGSSAGESAALITFIIALLIGLLFRALDDMNKGFSMILYPVIAITFGYLGVKYGSHYIDVILQWIVNKLVSWDTIGSTASGFESFKQYIKIALTSGIVFTSPIGMYGIVPMMQQSVQYAAISNTTILAGSIGVMSFMLGFTAMGVVSNDPGITAGIFIGTPTFQFGNIVRRPQTLIPPVIATIVSTFIGMRIFHLTSSFLVMKLGNCCMVGLVELYKLNGWPGVLTVTLTFIIIPIAITILVYIAMLKLNLIHTEDTKVDL